ncbi:MAG: hypothetical protein HC916_06885 [Coleofasciculaceae cyanobacterium SM2_1_6]|nr:hypothetical protein [Coleofasciculaceae cyanobacterium SM2_1_6]
MAIEQQGCTPNLVLVFPFLNLLELASLPSLWRSNCRLEESPGWEIQVLFTDPQLARLT